MALQAPKGWNPLVFRQWGLHELLKAAVRSSKTTPENTKPPVELHGHPFGLQVPSHFLEKVAHPSTLRILFLGWPGYTDQSVEGLLTEFAGMYLRRCPVDGTRIYLRLIFTEHPADHLPPGGHDVYAEIGYAGRVIICDGCNDCSGAGKEGTWRLTQVLCVLADLFGVEIETPLIPVDPARLGRKYLEAAILTWNETGGILTPSPHPLRGYALHQLFVE